MEIQTILQLIYFFSRSVIVWVVTQEIEVLPQKAKKRNKNEEKRGKEQQFFLPSSYYLFLRGSAVHKR